MEGRKAAEEGAESMDSELLQWSQSRSVGQGADVSGCWRHCTAGPDTCDPGDLPHALFNG